MWERQDPQGRGALYPGRHDVLGIADRQGFGPRDAGKGRPSGQRDGQYRVLKARPEGGDEGQGQDQPRKGQEDIGEAHQKVIDPAAHVAGHRADRQADGNHDHADQGHDVERHPRSPDDPGVDVPAQLVGAEPMLGAGRHQAVGQILLAAVALGQQGREEGHQQQRGDDHETRHGNGVGAEGQPGQVGALAAGLEDRAGAVRQQPGPEAPPLTPQ